MKPKALRRHLQNRKIRPTKAAYRVMKRHPESWPHILLTHRLSDGTTLAFTRREAAMLRRKELNRRITKSYEAQRAATRRERTVSLAFTLFVGLPAAALVLFTTIAIYSNLP